MKEMNMTIEKFLQKLELELTRAGIWGRAARQLEVEIFDHFQAEKGALLRQGKSAAEAETMAIASLGLPHELA